MLSCCLFAFVSFVFCAPGYPVPQSFRHHVYVFSVLPGRRVSTHPQYNLKKCMGVRDQDLKTLLHSHWNQYPKELEIEISQEKDHSSELRNEASDMIVSPFKGCCFQLTFLVWEMAISGDWNNRDGTFRLLKDCVSDCVICGLGRAEGPSAFSCLSPVGLSLVRIVCFPDKRLRSVLTAYESPWKV